MYRARWQIWSDILAAAIGGTNKTGILYHAGINTVQRKKYVWELIKIGCIVCHGSRFKTTEKGKRLMNCSRELEQLLGPGSNVSIQVAGV